MMDAIVIRNSLISIPQPLGDDKVSARIKSKEFSKFLDSLDLKSRAKKSENMKKGKTFLNMFARAGVPIIDKGKK